MSGTIEFDIRKADGAASDVIQQMIEAMREVTRPPEDFDAQQIHHWLGMARALEAAATAGVHYGTLAAAGIVANQRADRRQALKIVEHNFRSGIDIALRVASRVADEHGSLQ